MTSFSPITTVYSYYLPEVRAVVDRLVADYPHDVFLRSVDPGLDDFHEPILDQVVEAHRHDVPALSKFGYRYPTNGSDEGIRELMTRLAVAGTKTIYTLAGDYEGYRETARTRGMETVELEVGDDPASLAPGTFFLSNPSARFGDVLPAEVVTAICEAGHKVVYDLSYLDATDPGVGYDLSHPNVVAALVSLSKPYGLFYYRVGFTFATEEIPSLFANKWFKSVFGLLLAERLFDDPSRPTWTAKYKAVQRRLVDELNREHGLGLRASDAFLLAHLPATEGADLDAERRAMIERFRRHDHYQFCLTPLFQDAEP